MFLEQGSSIELENSEWDILANEISKGVEYLISNEFNQKNRNSWGSCMRTRLTVINSCVYLLHERTLISDEDNNSFLEKIGELLGEAKKLQDLYPEKQLPPEDVRNPIIDRLQSLVEAILAKRV